MNPISCQWYVYNDKDKIVVIFFLKNMIEKEL